MKRSGDFSKYIPKAQLDLTNIESVFTALELGKTINAPFPEHELTQAIAALKTLIVETLEQTIVFPMSRAGEFLSTQSYGSFSQLLLDLRTVAIPRRSVSVITFNYDIALDLAVHRRGLGPDYAITSTEPGPDNVHVMKLHGSLNWASVSGPCAIIIRPLHIRDFINEKMIAGDENGVRIPISRYLIDYFRKKSTEVDREPVIVPPTWNKAGHYSMLSNVWATAARISRKHAIFLFSATRFPRRTRSFDICMHLDEAASPRDRGSCLGGMCELEG